VTHTDWLPGILVLALGLLAAAVALFLARRRVAPGGAAEARRAGARLDAEEAELRSVRLLDQLRELEADRHQLSAEAYQAESSRLEHRAADALRARDEARTSAPKSRPSGVSASAPSGFFGRHPQLAGAFWGAGLALFFGALFLWVTRDAAPRSQGEGLTGTAGRGESNPPPPEDSTFSAALARVQDDPGDVETVHVVHELIRRQDYDRARQLTERSLGVDPFLSEARAHRGFLLAVSGDTPGATRELQHVSELYPNGYEALVFLGLVRMRSGDNRGAADAFDRFLAEAPPDEQPPQMRAALTALRQQLRSQR
jgi:tetratricopeptide (TPR) repeat protein